MTPTRPRTSDLWLSGSAFHFWNPNQPAPATDWERRIDVLMRQQVTTTDQSERKALFDEVQQIFAAYIPAIYLCGTPSRCGDLAAGRQRTTRTAGTADPLECG